MKAGGKHIARERGAFTKPEPRVETPQLKAAPVRPPLAKKETPKWVN